MSVGPMSANYSVINNEIRVVMSKITVWTFVHSSSFEVTSPTRLVFTVSGTSLYVLPYKNATLFLNDPPHTYTIRRHVS